jgi:putative DNA primase/helicase
MSRLFVRDLHPIEQEESELDEARATVAKSAIKLIRDAIEWHELPEEDNRPEPPHAAIKITTGVGKSHATRAAIPEFVAEMKRRGHRRVLFLVPTHALGSEAKRMLPEGLTAEVWQGRGVRKVDGVPTCTSRLLMTGEPMCRNPAAVAAAEQIGAAVDETACKQGKGDDAVKCEHFDTCAFQIQKAAVEGADVVFAAHELLFHPQSALGDFGLVIIDEGFWQDGLVTNSKLGAEGLAHDIDAFPVRDRLGVANREETAHLADLIARLQTGLRNQPDGYVSKAPLIAAGLLPSDKYEEGSARRAVKYEWARKNVVTGLRPDANPSAWAKASEDFRFLGLIPRRAAMWQAIDDLLSGDDEISGHLVLETKVTTEGSFRYLRILTRRPIRDKILGLPILHLDATMQIDLVKHFLPRLTIALDLDVPAPHEHVTQLVGFPVGKSSLSPGTRTPAEEERVARKRKALADFVRITARGRRALAITYKSVEDNFPPIPGVELAHWGNIEGRDEWGDVALLVTAGRPMPGPAEIQRMAAALTGRAVEVELVPGQRTVRLKPGGEHQIQTKVYNDPDAELVRLAVAEAALAQGVGRGRGVKRGSGDPLEVFVICSDVAYPLPVDEVFEFKDARPGFLAEMIHAGIVPAFPSDAAKLYPAVFKSRDAARKAYLRAGIKVDVGDMSYKELLIRVVPDIVRYQPTGRGQPPRLALVDLAKVPDPQTVLTQALGPLAKFEFAEPPAALRSVRAALVASIRRRATSIERRAA